MEEACNWRQNIGPPKAAEALAAVSIIRFAKDMGFQRVIFKGDTTMVIPKLQVPSIDRSKFRSYIWEAKQLLLGFERFKFHHIKKGKQGGAPYGP